MSNGNVKMRSSISDEELAMLIEDDKKRNPSDFSCGSVVFVDSPSKTSFPHPRSAIHSSSPSSDCSSE